MRQVSAHPRIIHRKLPALPVVIELTGGIGDNIQDVACIETLYRMSEGQNPFRIYTRFPDIVKLLLPWADDIRLAPRFHAGGEMAKTAFWIEICDIVNFKLRPGIKVPAFLEPFYQHWLGQLGAWGPLIASHPHKDFLVAADAIKMGLNRRTLKYHLMGLKPLELPAIELASIPLPYPYITVHDGVDACNQGLKDNRSTKQWNLDSWGQLTQMIRKYRPDLKIIQLGNDRSRPIPGTDLNLAGKLIFIDSLEYLKRSWLHIDGDSGLVHAKRLFGWPCDYKSVVLFGPTDLRYYGYTENVNIPPKVCGNCWWQKNDWVQKCILGYPLPLCMDSITPDDVMARVVEAKLL